MSRSRRYNGSPGGSFLLLYAPAVFLHSLHELVPQRFVRVLTRELSDAIRRFARRLARCLSVAGGCGAGPCAPPAQPARLLRLCHHAIPFLCSTQTMLALPVMIILRPL